MEGKGEGAFGLLPSLPYSLLLFIGAYKVNMKHTSHMTLSPPNSSYLSTAT